MTRWCFLVMLAAASLDAQGAEDASVATYTASYRVEYKGKEAGTAEFVVRYLADRDVYEFSSSVLAKGLLKLARPKPAVERSHFRLTAGAIQPLEFWYEDGSRSGDDNFHVVFEWERRVATVSSEAGRREIALPGPTLDRGSLQVALMRDVAAGGMQPTYKLADEDSIADYEYTEDGTETVETGAGPVEARIVTQQRAGSSRATRLWLAPELRFLPVRIEQRRDGEVQTAFALVSVDGLAPSP